MPRECVFCAKPITNATASREDTVPKWLQAELGIATSRVEPTLTAWNGEQLLQRVHPVDQLRTGGICRSCNNGWMSQLESQAMPILSPLMRSIRELKSLTRGERSIIARWALKTAFMLDLGGLESHVPLAQVRELFANAPHLPRSTYVFSRQQPATGPWYYMASPTWNHASLDKEAQARVERESYKIAFQFGDLILITAYWPLLRWGLRIEKGELTKLWPPTAIVKNYTHPVPQDVTLSDAACRRFVLSLSVVPHRGAEGYVPANAV